MKGKKGGRITGIIIVYGVHLSTMTSLWQFTVITTFEVLIIILILQIKQNKSWWSESLSTLPEFAESILCIWDANNAYLWLQSDAQDMTMFRRYVMRAIGSSS